MKKFILRIWYAMLSQFDHHRSDLPEWYIEEQPFEELPDNLKRVAVAKDILEQVNLQKYRPKRGGYIDTVNLKVAGGSLPIKENFNKINNCTVCALGACFLSTVKFTNKFTFDELYNSNRAFSNNPKVIQTLEDIFPLDQLRLIETAFETGSGTSAQYRSDVFISNDLRFRLIRAKEFGYKFDTAMSKMEAIMRNIIKNNGEFKP